MISAWLDRHPMVVPAMFMSSFIVVGVTLGMLWAYLDEPTGQARAVCDRYVNTLLNSSDITEITRAGIIVRETPCDLRRRLNQ